MKKKLAVLMAAIMMVTLVPFQAFASTLSPISNRPQKPIDTGWEVNDDTAPLFNLTVSAFSLNDAFDVTLTKAEWNFDEKIELETNTTTKLTLLKTGDTTGRVELYNEGGSLSAEQAKEITKIKIPMYVIITGTGSVTFKVNQSLGGAVTPSTQIFANGIEEIVTINAYDNNKIYGTDETIPVPAFTISQLGNQIQRNDKLVIRTGTSGVEFTTSSIREIEKVLDAKGSDAKVEFTTDENDQIVITFDTALAAQSAITIPSGTIKIFNEDGIFGDVFVKFSGIVSHTAKAGTYSDYSFSFGKKNERDKIEEVQTGRKFETTTVALKELVADSINGARKFTFELTEGTEIYAVELSGKNMATGSTIKNTVNTFVYDKDNTEKVYNVSDWENPPTVFKAIDREPAFVIDGNRLTVSGIVPTSTTNETTKVTTINKVEIYAKFIVLAKSEGEVTVKTYGSALGAFESEEVTIATAKNPFEISTTTLNVTDGKNVTLSDITIKETEESALRAGNYIYLGLEGLPLDTTSATVEVTQGDVRFESRLTNVASYGSGEFDLNDKDEVAFHGEDYPAVTHFTRLTVKSESTEPSTVVIKGLKVNRISTAADIKGEYLLYVLGDVEATLVAMNYKGVGDTSALASTYVKMVIGEQKMTVGTTEVTMDAAPYIQDSRTMLPLRYVAEAFGINADQIKWDNTNRVVTINTPNKAVQIKIGSNIMTVDGRDIIMDTAATITQDRTFLPIYWVSIALGVEAPSWDDATKTVEFYKNSKPQ